MNPERAPVRAGPEQPLTRTKDERENRGNGRDLLDGGRTVVGMGVTILIAMGASFQKLRDRIDAQAPTGHNQRPGRDQSRSSSTAVARS